MSLEVTTCLGCTKYINWREDRLCRDCRTKKASKSIKPKRRIKEKGYLSSWEAMDAFESGRPMSSDDY